MDLTEIVILVGGLLGGGIAVYLVAIQGVKASINKEAKGLAFDQVFKQVGLSRTKVKDWNDLTPQGVANLVTVIRSIQASTGTGLAGAQTSAINKALAELAAYSQMAGSLGLGNPLPPSGGG